MDTLCMRQSLLRAAYRALADCDLDVSRTGVRVGWLMIGDDAEEIAAQRRRSAGFEWVAVGYSPNSFFDLHAGLVARGGHAEVGVHAHRRSPAAAVLAESELKPFEHIYAELVEEEQLNFSPVALVDGTGAESLAAGFGTCLQLLRHVAERFGS